MLSSDAPGEFAIDVVRRLHQFAFAVLAVGMNDAVLHVALVDDQDHQYTIRGQREKLDLAQHHLFLTRQRNDARHAADLGEQTGCEFDEPRRREVWIQPIAQHLHAAAPKRLHRQQRVDEKSQAEIGWDLPGRRVR